MFLDNRAVSLDRRAEISAALGFLRPLKKLLRGAAHFLLARRLGLKTGFFAGFKHDGRPARDGPGETNQKRQKKDAEGEFHRVAQGS